MKNPEPTADWHAGSLLQLSGGYWQIFTLHTSVKLDLFTCLAQEAEGIVRSAQTADHREAVRAFVEKRKPEFQGR